MPRESSIQRSTLKRLRELPGVKAIKIHGGPYQEDGLPDILVLANGRALGLELKRPGEALSPIQEARRRELLAVGVPWVTATSSGGALAAVKDWMGTLR